MRLTDDTYEFIKNEAADTLVRYDMHQLPIDGFELAMKMGIILVPYSSLSLKKQNAAYKVSADSFYLEPGDGQEYIYYNDTLVYERSNMNCMHEIGHAVLGHDKYTDPETAEAEAGFFARYMIAPIPLISKLNPCAPCEISQVFSMSLQASGNAYSNWQKRMKYGDSELAYYEIQILAQFKEVMPMNAKNKTH